MAKKLEVYVLKPDWYCIRRSGKDANGRTRDKNLTVCNKRIFDDQVCTTTRPRKLPMCGMCQNILNSFPGKKKSAKKKLARRKK